MSIGATISGSDKFTVGYNLGGVYLSTSLCVLASDGTMCAFLWISVGFPLGSKIKHSIVVGLKFCQDF